jgi:hypothetical protein
MTLKNPSQLRQSFGISKDELDQIKAFLQGSVYCWIKNKKDQVFAGRDLMGGENFYWEGTPLIALYEKHIKLGKNSDDAVAEAGKDMGWILKLVLHEDKRTFESCDAGMAKGYKWDGKGI